MENFLGVDSINLDRSGLRDASFIRRSHTRLVDRIVAVGRNERSPSRVHYTRGFRFRRPISRVIEHGELSAELSVSGTYRPAVSSGRCSSPAMDLVVTKDEREIDDSIIEAPSLPASHRLPTREPRRKAHRTRFTPSSDTSDRSSSTVFFGS